MALPSHRLKGAYYYYERVLPLLLLALLTRCGSVYQVSATGYAFIPLSILCFFLKESHYIQITLKKDKIPFMSLRMEYLHKLFGILLFERCIHPPHYSLSHSFLCQCAFMNIYTLDCHLILFY